MTTSLELILKSTTVACGDVRCPGCGKLVVKYHRPTNARLDLKCPRCNTPFVVDVEADR